MSCCTYVVCNAINIGICTSRQPALCTFIYRHAQTVNNSREMGLCYRVVGCEHCPTHAASCMRGVERAGRGERGRMRGKEGEGRGGGWRREETWRASTSAWLLRKAASAAALFFWYSATIAFISSSYTTGTLFKSRIVATFRTCSYCKSKHNPVPVILRYLNCQTDSLVKVSAMYKGDYLRSQGGRDGG